MLNVNGDRVDADPDRLRELLARLDDHLDRQQVPIVDAWQPGLDPEQARTAVDRELGLQLPVEAETWFAWHDGVDPSRYGRDGVWMVASDLFPMPLSRCIGEYHRRRRLAERLEEPPAIPADDIWHPLWFPLLGYISEDLVFLDTNVPPGAAAPVHIKYAHDAPSESHQPRVPSLTDAVSVWVRMFDEGRYRFDPSTGRLDADTDGLDPQMFRTGLI